MPQRDSVPLDENGIFAYNNRKYVFPFQRQGRTKSSACLRGLVKEHRKRKESEGKESILFVSH